MPHGTPRKPWPFPALLAGIAVFGLALAVLRVGIIAGIVLCAIAAAMGIGRP